MLAAALLAALFPATLFAASPLRNSGALPARVTAEKLANRLTAAGDQIAAALPSKAGALRGLTGTQRVIVRLTAPAAVRRIQSTESDQQAAYKVARAQQSRVIAAAKSIDGNVKILGRTGLASNVVMMKADTKTLAKLAKSRDVVSIVPVKDYTLDLSETVPYVGAKAVQAKGYSGQGVDVAILDTGIDYTHAALGGAGTEAAFKAAYGTSISDPNTYNTDTTFPTARVKGGYDFTGEFWTGGLASPDEAPDPDPIDSPAAGVEISGWSGVTTSGGHGTHVADIIGGKLGMAPKANLYAVKVCSSTGSSCSGIALMNAMDWAMDPNGDGSMADHVDVINMSLGSDYGAPYDDDLSMAVEFATKSAGILTVAASGNGGNKPYISGTPAAAPSAISVAQTQVPSAVKFPLVISAPAGIAGTYKNVESVDWAPIGDGFEGDVIWSGGNGCTPAAPGTYHGEVVLINRGVCSVSLKVDGAAKAGAGAVLIGLVAPGDAVQFSNGGGDTFVPTLVIQQSLSTAIKAAIASPATVHVSVSGTNTVALVGGVVGSSSRGPSLSNRIKPEIGAPGASVSAISGSGTATEAFGGTSGATPMVTGAAALLRGAFPGRSPLEIKAVLMNTAEMNIKTDNAVAPYLAPITRIGGGELRVNRALASPIAIWDAAGQSGSISFGFVDGSKDVTLSRVLTVRNYTASTLTYKITSVFRYGNDRLNGAVTISAPTTVTLGPKATTTVKVKATIDASKLRDWVMNGSSAAVDPATLDLMEYDGYLKFDRVGYAGDNAAPAHVAWQVLPRSSGDVQLSSSATVTTLPTAI
ncbi:MAG: S8 family serine peptidase, partial [Chloroflexota bacterium]